MALPFVACNKEELTEPVSKGEQISISVKATAEDLANLTDTKTYIDGMNVLWGENEQMSIFLINGNTAASATSTGFIGEGEAEAMFAFNFNSEDIPANGPYTYGGIYPASAEKGLTSGKTTVRVELPATQNATATSYDPAAYIMVAKPQTFDEVKADWFASYRRATALNKITLTGISEDIASVAITVPEGKYLAGRRYIDVATGESGEIYFGGTNTVMVNYATALPHTAADVWFTSWGVDVAEGEAVTVKVTTVTNKAYTKTFNARAEGIKFTENYLNTLAVDMSDATVEDIEGILDGEYLIAAYTDKGWALLTPENTTGEYFIAESTTIKTSISDITCAAFYGISGIDSNIWTIKKTENGYTVKNGDNYIQLIDENAKTSESPISLLITKNEDGTVFIEEIGQTNRRSLQYNYNNGSPRFKLYLKNNTSTYPSPVLIPWIESSEPIIIVTETDKSVNYNTENVTFEYSTKNIDGNILVKEIFDEDNIISSASAADGIVSVSLVPNTEEREKTATIELSYEGAEPVTLTIKQNAKPAAGAKYYVKVTEELTDWSGQYLIVYEDMSVALDGSLTSESDFDAVGDHQTVSIETDRILSTSEIDKISFTIASISGGYSIQGAAGYYIYNSNSKSNDLKASNTETGLNTISIEEGSCKIVSETTILRFNTTDDGRFRYYKSSSYASQEPIQLYKLQ